MRPYPPTQPPAWVGGKIDWWVANSNPQTINDTSKAAGYGVLIQMTTPNPSLASGWLAATPDSTAATPVAAPGHVFGVNGQGDITQPRDGVAFAYRAVAATATHGMMVNLFPYDMTDAGIASGKTVVI